MSVEYKVVNPATGTVEKQFPTATDNEIATAIGRSDAAYRSWSTTPPADRAALLHRVADAYAKQTDELAAIITREMGKTTAEAVGEIEFVVEIYRYYADQGPTLLADEPIPASTRRACHRAQVRRRPAARDHAVELPVLPGRPVRRPEPDGGQHDPAQARAAVPRVGPGDGADLPRRRPARRTRTSTCSPPTSRSATSSPTRGCAGVSVTGSERAGTAVAAHGRRAPEEGRARARRLRPVHRAGHRRPACGGRRRP